MKKIALFLIFGISLLLTSCDFAKDEDVWVVGTSADNPPYEYMENGEIVGFDIDFILEIGKHLGKRIEFKNMEFHSLLAALSSNNVDLVVAGMSITNERKNRVDFSIPYTSANIAVLYLQADNYKQPSDFVGKTIAGQLGSIFSIVAHQMAVEHKSKSSSLSNNLLLVEELRSRRIDGIVLETSQAAQIAKQYKNLAYFELKSYGSSFAIAMPRGSKIKNNIDHTIKSLRTSGKLAELEQKWGISSANK